MPGGCCAVGAVSPNGRTVFVAGYVKTYVETVAYSAATGARLWTRIYEPGGYVSPDAMTVSRNGTRVCVTGNASGSHGRAGVTVAYNAGTGGQLWASRYVPGGAEFLYASAVSPDGTTLYAAGQGSKGSQPRFAVLAYAAATGKLRWLRYYRGARIGQAKSVAVSPDGKTVYAAGSAGPSLTSPAAPVTGMFPTGLVIDPRSSAAYVGGDRLAAYSVATGRLVWISGGYTHGSIFGRSADGARLFGVSWNGRGIIIVAYQS
ncbi:MAG: outer membrane protein assembly factor BamB family protein [Streptosporangiaceae bacterium]